MPETARRSSPKDDKTRCSPEMNFCPPQPTTAWLFMGIVTLSGVLMPSSANCFPDTAFRTSLSQVADWIDKTGKPTVIRGTIAKQLGFSTADLPVRERGFRKHDEKLTHVCSSIDLHGFEDTIFLALIDEATGDAVVWRATRDGNLVSAAQFKDGLAQPLPNEISLTAFIAEKDFFIKEMRTQAFRTNPAPRPIVQSLVRPAVTATWTESENPRPSPPLPSEFDLLLVNPWVMPVIAMILAVAATRSARTRQ